MTTLELPLRKLADLLRDLGDVPADRILMTPPPGTATEADLLRLVDGVDPVLCELVDGTLVEKPIGLRESLLGICLGSLMREFVVPRNLGILTGSDGTLRLWQGLVRLPDVAFISWDRLPGRRIPKEPIPELAPDLAVEVLSASNTRAEMARKRREYFKAGVQLVWEIGPDTRAVAVYTAIDKVETLRETDILDG